jgi:3-keto-disaccharide hydrolase
MLRVLPAGTRFVAYAVAILTCWRIADARDRVMNTLTPEEQAAGWKLLFDGKTLAGWQGFKSQTPPTGWEAVDGLLVREGSGSGDLMTADEYGDFELQLEWKISKGGNSGIMFHVTTDGPETWSTGPEMQVLDNAGHKDGQNAATSAGSNYALHAPVRDVTKPVGEWNAARILVGGRHVEHWLNGVKIVEYELWSPDWEARVKASKFGKMPGYGRAKKGHIALQDHGDLVWYRNIKIRPM